MRAAIARHDLDGAVHLLGWRDDVRSLVAAADVFVFSSLSEGSPSAVLEAMAIGTPVVAFAIAPVVELTGGHARLATTGSSVGLAEEMLAAYDRPGAGRRDRRRASVGRPLRADRRRPPTRRPPRMARRAASGTGDGRRERGAGVAVTVAVVWSAASPWCRSTPSWRGASRTTATAPRPRRDYGAERAVIDQILEVFDRYDISATWAIVGHLFLDHCAPVDGRAHPEIVRPVVPDDRAATGSTSTRARRWRPHRRTTAATSSPPSTAVACRRRSAAIRSRT